MDPIPEAQLSPVDFAGGRYTVDSTNSSVVNLAGGRSLHRLVINGRVNDGSGRQMPQALELFDSRGRPNITDGGTGSAIRDLLDARDVYNSLSDGQRQSAEKAYTEAITAGASLVGDALLCAPYLKNQEQAKTFRSALKSTNQ